MKRFVLSFLILVSCLSAFSQKIYFLYLQSDNDQPFFVKMNEKIYSSAASGYVILPGLRDSSYTFSIGFPQNKFPEQKFAVDIRGKDRGYLLKNLGEKGWGLFDLQALTIQMALPDKSGRIKTEPRTDITPFTEILARAANDPSLKERPVAVKMEEQPVTVQSAVLKETVKPPAEPVPAKQDSQSVAKKEEQGKTKKETLPVISKADPPIVKSDTQSIAKRDGSITRQTEAPVIKQNVTKDSTAVKSEQPIIAVKEETPVVKEEPARKKEEIKNTPGEYRRSVVTKKSESSTSEGLGLTFIDEYTDGKKDTIRIVIPNPRISPAQKKETTQEDKKFLDISTSDTARGDLKTAVTASPVKSKVTNTTCKVVASESDLSKLQKKMMGEKNDDDMVGEARKVFRSKCFTAEQLKSLSALFMNDAGKYKFFDTAYAYVSDTENFSLLSAELKDEYYVNRFKAMLR
jgi:hypothetical protein